MDDLKEYREKRNFARTAEPSGRRSSEKKRRAEKRERPEKAERASKTKRAAKAKDSALKFTVQLHAARRLHYDLRLEWRGVLLSWAVPKGPSFRLGDKRLAVRVEDHPLEYADFEGVIPKGEYGGGTVLLWDEGTWEPLGDPDAGLRDGSLKFTLKGARLYGKWALVRMKEGDNWLLLKERDAFAKQDAGIEAFQTSVRSGRTLEQIAAQGAKNPFQNAEVCLAEPADEPPEGEEWLFEVKYDGYRALAFVEAGEVRLVSRNEKSFGNRFQNVCEALKQTLGARAAVLDGELVVADENGRTDFSALQRGGSGTPVYLAFDLLALDGKDLRGLPLTERKAMLENLLEDAPEDLRFSRHVRGRGRESLDAAKEFGFEGVVAKRADAPYRGGRKGDWVKIKCFCRQEFVIGGYVRTGKRGKCASALLLGFFEDGRLRYAGRAGTGWQQSEGEALAERLDALARSDSPFSDPVPKKRGEEIRFAKPETVAEIRFAEWTPEGVLRQASFLGLREDKSADKVKKETARARGEKAARPDSGLRSDSGLPVLYGVEISHPDRPVFSKPKITKLRVAEYYACVADRMLTCARGRILSVVRCHKGAEGGCFFKKHPDGDCEGKGVTLVTNAEGETSEYFYLEDERGLLSEVQLGTVEFHLWGSRAADKERPDLMVFDLDPDEGMPLSRVRKGVRDLKEVLDALGLSAFLKVSGGKGYHVVVPFVARAGWETFSEFAHGIAQTLEAAYPERYTANMRKSKRADKIFIDWVRNGRGATSVAPYSLRARAGAKVAMPVFWEELDQIPPDGIDLDAALDRLSMPDPWADLGRSGIALADGQIAKSAGNPAKPCCFWGAKRDIINSNPTGRIFQ